MVKGQKFFIRGLKSDPLILKVVNLLMKSGKRSKAEKILYKTLQSLDKEYPGKALHILYLAIIAVKQDIAVRLKPKSQKRGKSPSFNVYLPRVISPSRGLNIGIRSLIKASRERSQSFFIPFCESLKQELVEASKNKGSVVEKRYKASELALSNKRRVHFKMGRYN